MVQTDLRALTSLGIFAEDTTGRFRQTALRDTLRSDHPESIRPFAMMLAAHSEDTAVFHGAMSSSPAYVAAIVGAYDFSKLERIVDVDR
jgi:hypothetical protein